MQERIEELKTELNYQ